MSLACEWLRKAHNDLKAAKLLLEEGLYDESAFHAQQATEKALKALLIAYRIEPPKTHNIARLLSLLKSKVDVSWAYQEDLPALTYYAVEIRYPAPPITREEALEAFETARRAVEWAENQLSRLGVNC